MKLVWQGRQLLLKKQVIEMVVNILYVNGGAMNRGGIETFMMNYLRHMDLNRVHIDFAVKGSEKGAYDEELEALGCKIYRLPPKIKHPIRFQKELKDILKKENYQIIHSHADAMNCWILKIAKECGVPVRIAHSHNTQHLTTNPIKFQINEIARKNVNKYATDHFACSQAAGKWLFGDASFKIIRNAIDMQSYAFNSEKRKSIRKKYGVLDDTILLGHVGRFDTQKNHEFLINMFAALTKKNATYKLMCVGDGWLRKDIEKAIQENNLADKVILLGQQENAKHFYNAFDLYVFPSLFEGLGFVLIEAQANGLTCVNSDAVPRETNLSGSDKMFYLPLESKKWVDKILDLGRPERYNGAQCVIEHGYDINCEAEKLENTYISMAQRKR